VYLSEIAPVLLHHHLGGSCRFRWRLVRLYPIFILVSPTTSQACEQLMRLAARAQFLPHFHHRLRIHLFFLFLFFPHTERRRHDKTETGECNECETHGSLL